MGGRLSMNPKIIGGIDQSDSEVPLPNPIRDDPRRQWIAR